MKFLITVFALSALFFGLVKARETSLLCGESSSAIKTSMVKPSTPPNECQYRIEARNDKICQMRIEFSMNLAQPEFPSTKNDLQMPECINDYLLINNFKLCGVENSQHLYVPINRTAGIDSIEILFSITQRKGTSKLPPLSWNVKVQQLECPKGVDMRSLISAPQRISAEDGFLLAPAGCDQYYPEDQGTIQSFNFNNGKGIYPYETNYAMCFRRTTATTGLRIYGENFNIAEEVNGLTTLSQTDSQCYPRLPIEGHVEDYLMIPQAEVVETEVRANYFCGKSIEGLTVLSTNPGPLAIVFNSGSIYKKGNKTGGFSLDYEILN